MATTVYEREIGLDENRSEIAARFWPPRFPVSCRDLAAISHQYHAAISAVISVRCRDRGEMAKSRRPKTCRDLAAILAEIAARSRKNFHKK